MNRIFDVAYNVAKKVLKNSNFHKKHSKWTAELEVIRGFAIENSNTIPQPDIGHSPSIIRHLILLP